MDRLIYTALSGMRRAEFAQAVTANNLANAGTTGFRRDTALFQSQWFQGAEFGDRVQAGSQVTGAEFDAGTVSATGRALDIAVQGNAMLAVRAPDGAEAYTRRGDLRLDPDGTIVLGDGRPVLGEDGPIVVPPADRVEIGEDGEVTFRGAGDTPDSPMNPAGRLKLIAADPTAMRKGLDGLFRLPGGREAQADVNARVQPGALEGSNVSMVTELAHLIEVSHAFDTETKMVREARDLDRATAELMRVDPQ